MKYDIITDEAMTQTLRERIASLEVQHYQAAVSVRLLEESGDSPEEIAPYVEQFHQQMEILDRHHRNASRYLEELKADGLAIPEEPIEQEKLHA